MKHEQFAVDPGLKIYNNYGKQGEKLIAEVDSNGNIKSRGEVLLPYHESEMNLSEIISSGREIRVVDDGKVYTLKEIYKELKEWADAKTTSTSSKRKINPKK